MSEENWVQRTVNASDKIDALRKWFGDEKINEIVETEAYKDAMAAMALALNQALNDTPLSRKRKAAAGVAMIDGIMTGTAIVFLMGWQARENANAV